MNIRLSNKHLQNKWNSARFCCQKILAPDPIKCVAKYWLSQRSRTWCTRWWPHPTESAAYQCTGRPPQISPTRLGKKKTLFTMAPLNNMHKGHCWWQQLVRPLSCLSRQIGHLTRLPRLIRPNWPPHPTWLTELLKLTEVITRNHGHFALVSQWICSLRGFGPPPQSTSADGYGPPLRRFGLPYQTFLLSIVYIVFGN